MKIYDVTVIYLPTDKKQNVYLCYSMWGWAKKNHAMLYLSLQMLLLCWNITYGITRSVCLWYFAAQLFCSWCCIHWTHIATTYWDLTISELMGAAVRNMWSTI